MIDFQIDDLPDEGACLSWLEQHLHPRGVSRPDCGASGRRFAQQNGPCPAWRCKACDRYYTLFTDCASGHDETYSTAALETPCPARCWELMNRTRKPGEKSEPHRDPPATPRRRANKRRGHSTYETDGPPIFPAKGRTSGQVRYFMRHHADGETCLEVVSTVVKPTARVLNTDEWPG